MFVNKLFTNLTCVYRKNWFNVMSSTCYFHMKTKILADFQICVSVPLTHIIETKKANESHPKEK